MARPIFFDLDGTLTDPMQGITRCVEFALLEMRGESPPRQELLSCIGPPLGDSFGRLLGTRDKLQIDRAITLYRERFVAKGMLENLKYEGIDELLTELRERGHDLFVVTSKPAHYARQIVEHFAIEHFFAEVFGPDMHGNLANKTELIGHVLQQRGLHAEDPATCPVMIGDRSYDMVGAKANGLPAVGVTWGYGSDAELLEAGAVELVSSPVELGQLLARL